MAGENEILTFDPKLLKTAAISAEDPDAACKVLLEDATSHLANWQALSNKQCSKLNLAGFEPALQPIEGKRFWFFSKQQ